MAELTNPHDEFFKKIMAQTEVAQEFMQRYLPADAVALLDLSSAEVEPGSFVDEHLKEYSSRNHFWRTGR
jgi:predicted transposase/invertase (TIGR01784 family)